MVFCIHETLPPARGLQTTVSRKLTNIRKTASLITFNSSADLQETNRYRFPVLFFLLPVWLLVVALISKSVAAKKALDFLNHEATAADSKNLGAVLSSFARGSRGPEWKKARERATSKLEDKVRS